MVKKVCIDRAVLQKGSIVLLRVEDDLTPTFASITRVYKNSNTGCTTINDFILNVRVMETVQFDKHYQAFQVENSNRREMVRLNGLDNYRTWNSITKPNNRTYIFFCHYQHFRSML